MAAIRVRTFNWLPPVIFALVVGAIGIPAAKAAISWDAEANTRWWFNPTNWSNNTLPPSNGAAPPGSTDTQINLGTGAWDLGEGVVYDPTNDPFFAAASGQAFPSGFGPQIINHLYMSRNTTNTNKLTIKGDLTFQERVHVGRSSGVRGQATNATIVQESGFVQMTLRELDLAQVDTSNPGFGNGTYDYRSGTLEVSQQGGSGMRLSSGSNSLTSDGLKAGPAGVGKFIIHNPATAGHIKVWALVTAAFAGFDEGTTGDPSDSVFDPEFDSNGETTGVGIFEFHYANGGTRPLQINTDMTLHNGVENNTKGIRSSRLDLVLDSAPCAVAGCVPSSIGLFDIGFDGTGSLLGSGDLDGDNVFSDDRVFSNIDNTDDYYEGDVVSATFGSTTYNWKISYTGAINWANPTDSTISSITGTGTGNDIVLIGLSSESLGIPGDFDGDGDVDGRDFLRWQRGGSPNPLSSTDLATWQTNYGTGSLAAIGSVPEPAGLVLLCVAALPFLGRRR
jgi:hypothetical protein